MIFLFSARREKPNGAWISGLLVLEWPSSPAGEVSGAVLELGRPPADLLGGIDPVVRSLNPESGTVVLFPAYFYRAMPPAADGTRLLVEFDVIAEGGFAVRRARAAPAPSPTIPGE